MNTGVVITYAAGREENVERALHALAAMPIKPEALVLVLDGNDAELPEFPQVPTMFEETMKVGVARIPKHRPGLEQPRNRGVREIDRWWPGITHAWFLDSDILVVPEALAAFHQAAIDAGEDAVLVGPYDWMPGGSHEPMRDLFNDPRWPMFNERGLGPFTADLGVALGNFGGNLVWPVEQFKRIGGFHPMLHHARCEDGELGLRAAAARIPMALVSAARGFHMAHPVNIEEALRRNSRDVPLLNAWHPWVESKGIVMTEQDGVRFDFRCSCGQQVNTGEMWQHFSDHPENEPLPDLILPDGLQ